LTAGITISVSTVADTIPPIMGTAIRCISSAPHHTADLGLIGKAMTQSVEPRLVPSFYLLADMKP
jgi:hypothetical protein